MEATEALQILTRAGRKQEADEIVQRAVSTAQAEYAAIESDESRTDDYKREELERVYGKRRAALTEQLTKLASSAARSEQGDAQRVFGTVGLSGDPASLAISRRDASDRVSNVQSRDELRDLLKRANRAGDEVLARAVAERALDNLDMETLNAFLADRPHLDEAAQRLWDAARATSGLAGSFQSTMALAALRPSQRVGR